jgi:hypothetical protein
VKAKIIGKSGFRTKYALQFCEYLIDKFNLNNSRYNLAIIPLREKDADAGMTVHDADNIAIYLNVKRHWIEFVHAIAHEMVHVRQIASGHLSQNHGKRIKWRGKFYQVSKLPPYLQRPWELEALQYEALLVRMYEDHLCTYLSKQDKIKNKKKP